MTSQHKHALIREMEVAGCELAYYADENSQECTLTVYWRGWQTTVIRLGIFDFERAYQEWKGYRDSVAYRIPSTQDMPRSAVRPQEALRRARRVRKPHRDANAACGQDSGPGRSGSEGSGVVIPTIRPSLHAREEAQP